MINKEAKIKADDTIKRAREIDEAFRIDGKAHVPLEGNEAAINLLLKGEYVITHFSKKHRRVKLSLKRKAS
jgi:hypothetical protein